MQGEMDGAGAAQPEMLALAGFTAGSIETAVQIAGYILRHEELAFAQRPEGNATSWIGALLQHDDPMISISGFGQRRHRA